MTQHRFVPSISHPEARLRDGQVAALLFIPAVCTVDWPHPPMKIRDTYSHPAVLASFVVGYAIIPPRNHFGENKTKELVGGKRRNSPHSNTFPHLPACCTIVEGGSMLIPIRTQSTRVLPLLALQ
jgi:hypothetical protein